MKLMLCMCISITSVAIGSVARGDLITFFPAAGESRTSLIFGYDTIATNGNTFFSVSSVLPAEIRTALEFDTSSIPLGATINSAVLTLTADISVGLSSVIALHYYSGDGSIESADFTATSGTHVEHNTVVSVASTSINSIDVTSMYLQNPFAGFRISELTNPGTFNFVGLDVLGGSNRPTLTIDYSVAAVPEPGSFLLMAAASLCVAGPIWRKSSRRNKNPSA